MLVKSQWLTAKTQRPPFQEVFVAFNIICKEGISALQTTKKAPFQVLFLYLKVVAAVVIGGLVLPVEVNKVVEDGALSVV